MAKHKELASVQHYYYEAMACQFGFHLVGNDTKLLDSASLEAEDLLNKLEARLSLYLENSDTSRINRAKEKETLRISPETVDCLLQAFDASARLEGKFHPFMGRSAIALKDQKKELGRFLDLNSGDGSLREPVIALDTENNVITKLREGPLLDLGGIGKGFALDRLLAHFREWEIEIGLLESGGSAYLAMNSPESEIGWDLEIGYEDRTRLIALKPGMALASSGELYQKSHVVDPENPSTEQSPWKRSYALADSGALADAASTASYLMKAESLEAVVSAESNLSFAVYSEKDLHYFGLW